MHTPFPYVKYLVLPINVSKWKKTIVTMKKTQIRCPLMFQPIGFRRAGSDFSAFLKEHKSPILHDLQHFNTSNGSETYWSVSYANYKFPPQIRRQNLKFLNWHKSIRIFFDIQTFLRKLSVILDWKTECVLHSRPLTANMHQAARI